MNGNVGERGENTMRYIIIERIVIEGKTTTEIDREEIRTWTNRESYVGLKDLGFELSPL